MTDDIYQENIKEETSLDDGVVNNLTLCGNHCIIVLLLVSNSKHVIGYASNN